MSIPESNIFDITAHPSDASSLTVWMLSVWELDDKASVLILAMPNEAKDINNRVRVKLSEARRQVKMRRQPLANEFGINTEYFPWTRQDGEKRVAIKFTQFKSLRHKIKQSIGNSPAFQALINSGTKK